VQIVDEKGLVKGVRRLEAMPMVGVGAERIA
jgi:hypothetical protein